MLTHLDLFSGIGGFSLGLEATGAFETVAFCEINKKCRTILAKHWPSVWIGEDIHELQGFDIDVITGGFPCQPYSSASRGRANQPCLWAEMLRVVGESRPRWIIAENVPGLGLDGIDRICADLEGIGYTCWPLDVDTSPPGRSRGRRRFLIVAYTDSQSKSQRPFDAQVASLSKATGPARADNAGAMGVANGLPNRVDRLRALGNAIVPQIATIIGHAIVSVEHDQV